ncbi:MAG: REP-associated tyrosine transposase [Pyrinomonadaceae bacterium]|jgi:REP element-mobilizing transposase RayT|nr:REP-associated tyrosine transposase [Pyrinomonadaceae bacterium]
MLKRPGKMRLFKSQEPNLVHYVTSVTFDRVPVFRKDHTCSLFIDALAATRDKEPFKLIGYVIMPNHIHLLANPLCLDISVVVGRLKGRSAVSILNWLRAEVQSTSLAKLALEKPLKSGQTHAVWMKEFSAIDIWSRKFIRQKLNYIHMNPVRAGLCDHPGKWRWSSYKAYLPHEPGSVPIEIDQRWLWSEEELSAAESTRTSPLSKQKIK